jgi:hypothetical protein
MVGNMGNGMEMGNGMGNECMNSEKSICFL